MGHYTRLVLNVALSTENTDLIATIGRMVDGSPSELDGRMAYMLKSSSYYHDNINHASFEYDSISKDHKLSVVCDLKNYEEEIERFLAMIAPYADDCFAGHVIEEQSHVPSLIWFKSGRLVRSVPRIEREVLTVLESDK